VVLSSVRIRWESPSTLETVSNLRKGPRRGRLSIERFTTVRPGPRIGLLNDGFAGVRGKMVPAPGQRGIFVTSSIERSPRAIHLVEVECCGAINVVGSDPVGVECFVLTIPEHISPRWGERRFVASNRHR